MKSGLAKTDSAQKCGGRSEGGQHDMGQAEKDRPEPHLLEKCCCDPIFRKESRGIKKNPFYYLVQSSFDLV